MKNGRRDNYARTKAIAEGIVLKINRRYGQMLTTAIRPVSIFGEGRCPDNEEHAQHLLHGQDQVPDWRQLQLVRLCLRRQRCTSLDPRSESPCPSPRQRKLGPSTS